MPQHLRAEQAYLVGTLGVEALPDVVEVEVHRVGADRGELPETAGHVAGHADHAQPQQPRPGLAEGRRPPLGLGAGRAAAHRERSRHPDGVRVPADVGGQPADVAEPLGEYVVAEAEAGVELVSEAGGELRRPAGSPAADDDARAGPRAGARLQVARMGGEVRALVELVVLAREAEALAA